MTKKNYAKPQMKAYEVRRTNVIATSGETESASSTEQYQKQSTNGWWQ